MKLHILSDIHLEFAPFDPPATDADVVILAGDIGLGPKAVEWAAVTFRQPVIFVPGNHEYYGGHLQNTLVKMRRTAEGTQVRVLDGAGIILGSVRFLAATLWTDFQITRNALIAQHEAQARMTDYRRIRTAAYRNLRPPDTRDAHYVARKFIERSLLEPFGGPTVVVTHHAPSDRSITPGWRGSRGPHLNAAYASDLEALMGPEVALWVHGHTHDSLDYKVRETRVLCNPRGYIPGEPNPGFNPGLVVEV
jgi:predicted phosphodiesterase